ncbi:histidinol-phosphate transaminase [Novosphingobium sp. ERN07]|uniref:pyridoxal phosphate-dependent aminotransferase n=1 Tax=Novosphingobium sp. ERN07 TaxID=2726187 RepID=UPI001F0F612E|nr:histidinol-phosphate transaminase [Novosphingobium sp. ERN07]
MSNVQGRPGATNVAALVQGGALTGVWQAQATTTIPELFGPLPGQARLTGNENPFGPAPSAVRAMKETVGLSCYYPDRAVMRLTDMIAERFGLSFGQIILGSGTTELLCATALAWGQKGSVICPELFWDAPINYAARKGVRCIRVPMDAGVGINLDGMADLLDDSVALVHIVNPNNPTGRLLDNQALRAFSEKVEACGATLLVDEAYNEMTDLPDENSLVDLVRAGRNVIVTRTFSKIYGMAGTRMGYALASEEHIARIRGYVTSFGGNVAGLAGAIASFNDQPFLEASLRAIREGRNMILHAVAAAGYAALPSQANFVFVDVLDADALRDAMANRGILVRGAFGEKWSRYSRVSVGTPDDTRRYADALVQISNGQDAAAWSARAYEADR